MTNRGLRTRALVALSLLLVLTPAPADATAAVTGGDGCPPHRDLIASPPSNWNVGWYHIGTAGSITGTAANIYNYSPWVTSGSPGGGQGSGAWVMLAQGLSFTNDGFFQAGWLEGVGFERKTFQMGHNAGGGYDISTGSSVITPDTTWNYQVRQNGFLSYQFNANTGPESLPPWTRATWNNPSMALTDAEATDSRNQIPGDLRAGANLERFTAAEWEQNFSGSWVYMDTSNSPYYTTGDPDGWTSVNSPASGELNVADYNCPNPLLEARVQPVRSMKKFMWPEEWVAPIRTTGGHSTAPPRLSPSAT